MRPEDEVLVERCRGGDSGAFDMLFERYEKTVFNVAFRMVGDREAARDITQSVFLKIFRHFESFDRSQRLFSWIYRIAVNESIDVNARHRPAAELHDGVADPHADPTGALDRDETRTAVQRALMTLPEHQRAVIVLRHFLECSYAEIGDVLEIPPKTVKSRLFDARRALRDALVESGTVVPR